MVIVSRLIAKFNTYYADKPGMVVETRWSALHSAANIIIQSSRLWLPMPYVSLGSQILNKKAAEMLTQTFVTGFGRNS